MVYPVDGLPDPTLVALTISVTHLIIIL